MDAKNGSLEIIMDSVFCLYVLVCLSVCYSL